MHSEPSRVENATKLTTKNELDKTDSRIMLKNSNNKNKPSETNNSHHTLVGVFENCITQSNCLCVRR